MTHYLDPKNDLIFKKIFGEHPDLLMSFLNALMPLPADRKIESVEYLLPDLVPENPAKKYSIVDVRCRDNYGRQFLVEMQMYWSRAFNGRMVFNVSKAYARQLEKGDDFKLLQPVYGLGIINDVFDDKTTEFYHHYQTINKQNTDEVIEGLEFVVVELPKLKPEKWNDRKMAVLWLRFLKEVKDQITEVSADLMENEDIRRALDICEEAAFTPAELAAYDKYWDMISTEKSIITVSHAEGHEKGREEGRKKGREEGREEGRKEGRKEGREEGRKEERLALVNRFHQKGLSVGEIADLTDLSVEQINDILNFKQ
jgi:predicted transposase/invertase (TIGR01784 family)